MPRLIRPDPPQLHLIVRRRDALESGMSPDEIRHRVRGGHWTALGGGIYLREPPSSVPDDPYAAARLAHLDACIAGTLRRSNSVIAYGSAAVAWRMPLATGIPARVELVVPPGSRNGNCGNLRIRLALLVSSEVDRSGPAVTRPVRTWIDVARTHGLADALSAGDDAMRRGLIGLEEVQQALDSLTVKRGVARAHQAAALLDHRRETALESLSFARFVEWGLPLPELQVEFRDEWGFIGRVDFYWRHVGLIGEADGRVKYELREDLYAEKRREDRLRAQGFSVVRWGWSDVSGVSHHLRRQLERTLSR